MAVGGPLTALAALSLHWPMHAAPPQRKTQILMGASFLWLLFSAALFAYALGKPKPSEKQRPTLHLHHQPQQHPKPMTIMLHGDFDFPETPTVAQQRERPKQHQLPEEGCSDGAKDSNCCRPTDETTGLLHDLERHNPGSSSSSGKCPEYVAEDLNMRWGLLQQFGVYAFVFGRYRRSLLCTFFLSFSTFIIYPIKMQCMLPCSSTDPALFQLLLIVIYHLGVVAGRCCCCCCCRFSSSSQRLIPAVLLLRLALLPLLFWLEASPAKLLPVLRAATAAIAPAGGTGLRGAAAAARAQLPLRHDHVAAAAGLAAGEQKHNEELLLLLVDVSRCLWLFVFAAVHGCLSLTGTLYTTRTPETYAHKAAAARLVCLFESTGLAVGTALSVAFSPPLQDLHGWKQAAATTLTHLA
ncbi:uncharacterized protein EMH_0094570 [Eimeria mitis]|uniref:Uncharacterized protein n=1 Tax=Eimeria mitis TaxID=44415 RepID=U6KHW8_9EIME|nr:uncharacterized protein EMH_0094570 [Eimeria mitis]CDJ35827.1 hypothetical protein, conserved [Eimeria mitis]